MAIGLGLMACLAASGCYRAEQQRAERYENYLKQTLGIAGRVGESVEQTHVSSAGVGHAPPAH